MTTSAVFTLAVLGVLGSLALGVFWTSMFCKPILEWVYNRMKPDGYLEETLLGERIEGKFGLDFWTTTFAWLFPKLVELVLANVLVLWAFRVFFGAGDFKSVVLYYMTLVVMFMTILCNSVVLPVLFMAREWRRRSLRVVVTTRQINSYALKFSLSGLLTGDAPLPLVSHSNMASAQRELRWAADPQELDEDYKTNWFTDQLIALRASLGGGWHFWGGGVRSILLATFFQEANDRVSLISWGTTLLKMVDTCGPRASKLELRLASIERAKVDVDLGRPDKKYEEADVSQWLENINLMNSLLPQPVEYDPFTVEDPGIWDKRTGVERIPYDSVALVGEPVYVGRRS